MSVYCNPQLIVNHGHEFAQAPFGKQDGRVASSYSFKNIIMRNYLLSLLVALLAVTGSLPVAAQRAYAVLTPDDGTLTFYYDNQYAHFVQNHGRVYDMPKPGERPTWAGDNDAHLYQENIKHVVFDVSFSKYRPISTRSWFECCINLKDIKGIRNLNTENVTDMFYMFSNCQALISLDLSNFNTQNVTNMTWMFSGCEALTSLDVSNFNTQNVIYMLGMFQDCKALTSLDVSNFNTQNVTHMAWMFSDCEALTSLDVSNFNTQNVTNMFYMFSSCQALTSLDVSNFNTQNVTNMMAMFYNCKALTSLDLSNFNTQNVTNMWGMFSHCEALTSLDLSNFNTQNVTNMWGMYSHCTSLTTIFCNNDWNVGRPVNDYSMFENCTKLKGTYTSFNANKTGIKMANPTTGYFTSKTTGLTM
ncbi:BspA family leucine-rich repeat surface protein [Hoylesella timonensis]|uniref:BspA family leucine-rich repeat surface protein n=1 Tax=Hoylesella timonensis TaxID=386414 RepID=UPI00242D8386|nr:BspA family leucine-rich repeat surface protein [Hoylesella timonensis]